VPCCKGQQSNIARLLNRFRQTALVRGADPGKAPRHNLAALGHKPLQQTNIPIGDGVNLLGAEFADLLAAEEFAASAGSAGSTGTASGTAAAGS
jgi:hypothetical protein